MARSYAHGRINFDDLNGKRSYGRWTAYGQSKLANLLFADELQRRLSHAGSTTISVAAHPGFARTELQASMSRVLNFVSLPLSQSAQMGVLPQLYAACSFQLRGGERIGPGGLFGMRGYPRIEPRNEREENPQTAARLWEVSEELTGVKYEALRLDPQVQRD
jgi:NAD(P)-dependent dehydrogenase (short-subunit alcohol dehydrogenase family)